jgi:hypothetical protein
VIKDIFYVASPICVNPCDSASNALDDEHVCSQLADVGYTVHVVEYDMLIDHGKSMYHDLLSWRARIRNRPCAILVQEIAAPTLLDHLTRVRPANMCKQITSHIYTCIYLVMKFWLSMS